MVVRKSNQGGGSGYGRGGSGGQGARGGAGARMGGGRGTSGSAGMRGTGSRASGTRAYSGAGAGRAGASKSSAGAPKKRKRRLSKKQRAIYRRRRIVALLALLLAIAVLVGAVFGIVKGIGALSYQIRKMDINAVSRSAVPEPAKVNGVTDCGSGDVTLALESAAATVASGGTIDFKASIIYTGKASCLVDASDASRVLVITSGDQTIWESDACDANPRKLLLANGDRDVQTITWNTVNSGTQCATQSSFPYAGAGNYQAQIVLKDRNVASQKVAFAVQ